MLVILLAVLLPLALILLAPWLWTFTRASRMTSSLPGPKPLPIIGNALEFGQGTVEILANLIRIWKEYGNVVRVWLGPKLFVFLADSKHVEVILSSSSQIKKNLSYRFLEPWLGTGLLTSTGSKWHSHRKIITPTFHFKILEQFVDVFNRNGDVLVEKLKKEVSGDGFDIYNYITLCTLDIICESAMGVSVNAQEDSESEYVTAVKQLADVVMRRTFSPWLYLDFFFNWTEIGHKQRKYLSVLHGTTRKVIEARKEELLKNIATNAQQQSNENEEVMGVKRRLAFLDLLLQYSREGANLTDEEIAEEVDTFMFEGHDTTASAITFALWLLATHPDIQEKVVEEIKEVTGDGDEPFKYSDLQELKYLERVLKEALRIYPSVPFFARELNDDLQLPSCKLPAGTNILFMVYMMNRNPEYFPDPEKFDPDRFLPDNIQGRHPYAYVPFSAGPRNCIGQKYAVLEMKSTVSKVLKNFKLRPAPNHELILSTELVLRSSNGVKVLLEPRKL